MIDVCIQLKEHCRNVLPTLDGDPDALANVVASFDQLQYKRKLNLVIVDQTAALLGTALSAQVAVSFLAAMLEAGKIGHDDLREVRNVLVSSCGLLSSVLSSPWMECYGVEHCHNWSAS